ncbi:MAG: acyltransferase family protein [Acidimicrobiia bacterium]
MLQGEHVSCRLVIAPGGGVALTQTLAWPNAAANPNTGRRLDVQGLRAIAVLAVVLYHAALPLPGGYLGVDVFFVISGYVITLLLLRELDEQPTGLLRRFYAKRVRRILPALGVMLATVSVLAILFVNPFTVAEDTFFTAIAAAFSSANLFLMRYSGDYFGLSAEANPFLHTWSLAVEEQFYLGYPLFLLALAALARRRNWNMRATVRSGLMGGGALSLAAFALFNAMASVGPLESPATMAFYLMPFRAWEFAAGAILATLPPARPGRSHARPSGLQGLVGLSTIAILTVSPVMETSGLSNLAAVVATMALIGRSEHLTAPATRLLRSAPLVRIGDLSYSWYLWHWPVIVMARALFPAQSTTAAIVGAAISVIPAAASFQLVESRHRHHAGRFRAPALAALYSAAPVMVALSSFGLLTQERNASVLEAATAVEPSHLDVIQDCDANTYEQWLESGERCTWAAGPANAPRVLLIGDSKAGQVSDITVDVARELGLTLEIATSSGCPFNDVYLVDEGRDEVDCRAFFEGQRTRLLADPPDVIVLAAYTAAYTGQDRFQLRSSPLDGAVSDVEERARIWQAGLERTLTQLTGAGSTVVHLTDIPSMPTDPRRECPTISFLLAGFGCASELPRSGIEGELDRVHAIEMPVLERVGVTLIGDVSKAVCDAESCTNYRDGVWRYRDKTHLSVVGAEAFRDDLRELLVAATIDAEAPAVLPKPAG